MSKRKKKEFWQVVLGEHVDLNTYVGESDLRLPVFFNTEEEALNYIKDGRWEVATVFKISDISHYKLKATLEKVKL